MRTRWHGGLLLPAILLTLSACGGIDLPRRADSGAETLQTAPAEIPPSSPQKPKASLEPDIRRSLESKDFESALKLLRREIKRGRPESALAGEYGRAINGLLEKADLCLKEGTPEKAGKLYREALDGFPETATVSKGVKLNPTEIEARLEDCAGQLMERGLTAYRAGDLDAAIRTWKKIHTFSPRHQASLKALNTAEVQRGNLEKVGKKN